MAKDAIKMTGIVTVAHTTSEYDVKLENGIIIKGTISGKMRVHNIRILPGDQVEIELSPYDLTRGRITFRK